MEFENLKKFFQKEYGKEITDQEFLEKLKIIIDDIDLLVDMAEVIRKQIKSILMRVEYSIENHKNCRITIEERKIVINALKKLSKIIVDNEDAKRFIEVLAEYFLECLNLIQKNNKNL